MASISKLVTAMVVLSAKPLSASGSGPTLTFDKTDEKLYDKYFALNATIAKMPTGSTMSERDALETMLVVSACNYAEAVADWAFGSEANYVYATRKWLNAHGMTHTTVVEPTGVDARNKSTPSDLITLGKLAMANPAIASIVARKSLDVPLLAGMPNTNDLLGTDGINGIKTGTLVPGGSDLLFSAVVPVGTPTPLTLTGVMLAGYSRTSVDTEVRALIESIKSGFHQVQLGTQGDVVGTYSTPWGAEASMVLGKSANTLTWSNEPITSSMTTTTIKTGKDGEKVGTITWTAGKSTVSVPIVLQGSIKGPSAWWRLTHPSELLGK
jgi:D-alanyl-D-alanine carboxypeptidase (penicillin-binding protein 5/6)